MEILRFNLKPKKYLSILLLLSIKTIISKNIQDSNADIIFTDQDLGLIRDNPEQSWAYVPEAIRDILKSEVSIADFDETKSSIRSILDNKEFIEKTSLEEQELLENYYQDLESGDALLIIDPTLSRNKKKVSVFCNLLVNKKIKANEVYADAIRVKNGIKADNLAVNTITTNNSIKADNLAVNTITANTGIETNSLAAKTITANSSIKTDSLAAKNITANSGIETNSLAAKNITVSNSIETANLIASSGIIDNLVAKNLSSPSGTTVASNKVTVSTGIVQAGDSSTTNQSIYLLPQHSGSIQASTGGNPRGTNSVDLQISHVKPDQVAAGDYSVIVGGRNNAILPSTKSNRIGRSPNTSTSYSQAAILGGAGHVIFPGNRSGEYITEELPIVVMDLERGNSGSKRVKELSNLVKKALPSHNNSSVICRGDNNTIHINADHSFIGNGVSNLIANGAFASVIAGGGYNNISDPAYTSTISGGGFNNIGTGAYNSVIAGGSFNTIGSGAQVSVISGGSLNEVSANAYNSVISGGYYNITNGQFSVICGGEFGIICSGASHSVISGGGGFYSYDRNTIGTGASHSIIGNGKTNLINSNYSVIGDGKYNTIEAGADFSNIGNGQNNRIEADASYSTIPGGYNNKMGVGSANSFAAGSGAIVQANQPGAFVWSDGTYGNSAVSNGSNSFNIYSNGGIYLQTVPTQPKGKIVGNLTTINSAGKLEQIAPESLFSDCLNPMLVNSGSAQNPTYSFCSNTGSGLYLDNADNLGFSIAGTNQATLTSTNLELTQGILEAKPNSVTHGRLIVAPNGSGPLQASLSGDARGAYAVDLQIGNTGPHVAAADYSVISGGQSNMIDTISNNATICGGFSGAISSTSPFSTIVGGGINTISNSPISMIGGGSTNTISNSTSSVIDGGGFNTINNSRVSVIGGGGVNSISTSHYSIIPGGYNNKIETGSPFSFAAGSGAIVQANHPGAFVWSDGSFGSDAISNGANTFNIYSSNGLYLNGFPIETQSSKRYKKEIELVDKDETINVYKLEPVKFYYNKNQSTGPKEIGLIAEDVEQYYKELVIYNKKGLPESVNYRALPVLMLNELKKLKENENSFKAEIGNLSTLVKDQGKEMENLKRYIKNLHSADDSL